MKEYDIDLITANDLVDYDTLVQAFKEYLMDVLEYDEDEADFVIEADFENPYDTPFISQEYEGDITVEGIDYEVRFCETDFCSCGLFHLADLPSFAFYMLFDQVSMKDQTVGSYQAAKKKYVILGIDDKEASE